MSLKKIQEDIDKWAGQFKDPYWKPHEMVAALTEEVGEVAREVNHLYGPKKKKSTEGTKDLGLELCDVIMAAVCLANAHGINLEESWQSLMDKLYKRDNSRFKKKEEN